MSRRRRRKKPRWSGRGSARARTLSVTNRVRLPPRPSLLTRRRQLLRPLRQQPPRRRKDKKEEADTEKPGKKEKIRFGQAPRETLPAATTNAETENAGAVPLESRDGLKCRSAGQSARAYRTNREDALQCARQGSETRQDECQRWPSGLDWRLRRPMREKWLTSRRSRLHWDCRETPRRKRRKRRRPRQATRRGSRTRRRARTNRSPSRCSSQRRFLLCRERRRPPTIPTSRNRSSPRRNSREIEDHPFSGPGIAFPGPRCFWACAGFPCPLFCLLWCSTFGRAGELR